MSIHFFTFPCPDRSKSISPFSVPISRFTPHNAAHKISELKRFLYFRISGVSLEASCDVGVTLTLTWLSRLDGPEPPAPKPKVRKLRCFCWRANACGGREGGDVVDGLLILILLLDLVLQIEWFGLFCCDVVKIVDCGELFDAINDLEGVEWTDELTAARY